MPHVHRNPESDEWWLVREGGPVEARVEGREASVPEGHALLVPRGVAHLAHGPTDGATMLVVERLPWSPPRSPSPPAGRAEVPLDVLDLRGLSRAYTPPWSFSSRPLLSTDSFVVETYARPEGMLRPEAMTEGPELWLVLRGALGVELGDAPPSTIAPADHALTLPAGLTCRVVSLHPDTVALRVRAPARS
jgi:mannose-6-phosphate isomerase-like protein (cupin superfamily)